MTLSRKVLRAGACALLCAWLPGIGRADDADQPRPRNSTSVGAAGGLFAPRLLPQDPPTTTAPPPTGGSLPTSITVPGGDRREFNYSPSASPAPTTPINAAPRQENREGRLPEGQSGAVTQPTPGTRPPTGNAPETGPKSSSPPVGEKSGDALHPIVSLISGIVSPLKGALPSAADPQKLQELYDKAKAGKPLAAEPPDSAKPDEKGVSADPKEKKNLTLDEMEDAAKKAAKADRDRIGSSEEPPPPSETPKKKKGPAPGEIFVARASDGSGYYYYLKGADSGRTFGRFVDGSKVLGWRLGKSGDDAKASYVLGSDRSGKRGWHRAEDGPVLGYDRRGGYGWQRYKEGGGSPREVFLRVTPTSKSSTGFAARVDVRQNGMRHSIYWQGADKIQAPVPKMPRSSAVYAAPPRPAPTVQPPTPTVPKAPSAPQVPKPAPVPEAPAAEPSAAVKELRESLDAFNRAMREARLSGREFKPLVLGKLGILPGVLENARELGLSEEEARGYLRLLLMPDAGSGNPLRRLGLTREEAGPYLRVLGAPAASPDLVEKLARLGLPLPASEEELAAARIGRVRLPPNPLEQNTIPLNKGDDFTCSSGETCKGGVCAGCSKMYQVQREELASGRTGAPPAGPRGIDELLRELHTRAQVEDVMSRIADLQGPPDLERQEANKTKFKPSSKINDDAYRDAASLQKDVRSAPQGLRVGVNRWNQDDGQHNHSVVLLAIPGNRDKSMIAVVEPNSILTGPDPARLSGSKYLAIDYTIFTLYGPTERRQTRIRAAD